MTKYKTVKLGPKEVEIPKEWSIVKIGEISQPYAGGTPSRSKKEYFEGSILWVKSGEVKQHNIYDTEEKITLKAIDNSSAKFVKPDTVLIAMYGATAGEVGILRKKGTCNQAVLAIPTNSEKIDYLYLYYMLTISKKRMISSTQGSGQPNLSKQLIETQKILLPPLPEQKHIAEILSTVDQSIEQTDDIIQETKKLKKGLMQDLLTRGIGHTEFKKVKLGPKEVEIPEEWELKRLGLISEKITDGTHSTPDYTDEGIPFLSTENLVPFSKDFDFSSYVRYITEESHKELTQRCDPMAGDLLISKCGTIGRTQKIRQDYEFSIFVGLGLVRLDKNISSDYIEQILNTNMYRELMELLAPGSTRKTLTISGMKRIKIILPPISEQRCISSILSSVDQKIEQEQEYKQELEQLKKGLMQDLLTGKVRVINNE